ncbi:MAG: thiol protease/hemagglutinin PrtT [Muribaculaceae bacterium]
MLRFIIAITTLITLLPLSAKQIGEKAAKDVANRFLRQSLRLRSSPDNGDLTLAYTASSSAVNHFFVYNLSDGGFVIVSADDCVEPVLGYCESGAFDINFIPDNMRGLLGEYQSEIDYAIAHCDDEATAQPVLQAPETATEKSPVAPLIATKWNQNSPFNDQCPMYDSEQRCVTGCTATAMAQIMNYYEWPKTCSGSYSYTTTINGKSTTLSKDFSQVTFDWYNMADVYDDSSTDDQKEAVATLMYAAGVGSNMYYGLSSGAYIYDAYIALVNYFNFDKSLKYTQRIYHSLTEWNDLVYNELANSRPVLYAGYNSVSGHTFVCDGYSSDNFFHINWGWSGKSDGYFKLSALTPRNQGIGGSDSGYNSRQEILYGFATDLGTTVFEYTMAIDGNFTCNSSQLSKQQSNTNITFNTGSKLYQYSGIKKNTSQSVNVGVEVTNNSTNETQFISSQTLSLTIVKFSSYSSLSQLSLRASSFTSLAEGTYTVRPAFQNTTLGSSGRIKVPYGNQSAVTMTVTSNTITFSNEETPKSQISVLSVESEANLYQGREYQLNVKLSNAGDDFCDNLYAVIYDVAGNQVAESNGFYFEVVEDETITDKIYGTLGDDVAAGNYTLAICTSDGSNYTKLYTQDVIIGETPAAYQLDCEEFTFPTAPLIKASDFKTICRVTNNGGLFVGNLYAGVLPITRSSSALTIMTSERVFIDAGETKDVAFSGSFDGDNGSSYSVALFEQSEDASSYNQIGEAQSFTVNSIHTGIHDVQADNTEKSRVFPNPATDVVCIESPEEISGISVYTASGSLVINADGNGAQSKTLQVETLPAGVYFIKVARPTGSEVMRIIKK